MERNPTPKLFLLSLLFIMASCTSRQEKGESQSKQDRGHKDTLTQTTTQEHRKTGMQIAKATGKTLKKHLSKAMAEGGPQHAIEFCNTAAYPLTDSMSHVHDARIKRTSHKIRNPKNRPDEAEKKIIEEYLAAQEKELPMKPKVQTHGNDSIAFYAPIKAKPLCLNCHGKVGEQVTPAVNKTIKEHYPDDEATGFEVGELRGIWSVRMEKGT